MKPINRKTRRASSINSENFGRIQIGTLIPMTGVWLRVAHVEEGVVLLTMDGYTGRGMEVMAKLQMEAQTLMHKSRAVGPLTISPEEGELV